MDEYETFVCEIHGERIAKVSQSEAERLGVPYGCQGCRHHLDTAPIPDSPEGRRDELRDLLSAPMTVGFDAVWKRVDALVGRSTYTHELAYPEYLEHEIMSGLVPSVEGIVAKFPHDMPVITVTDAAVNP
jgi:hypothetical protein